ncbi:transposase-like zinc-binding domain-containing protein [Flavobacterium nitratireducens]
MDDIKCPKCQNNAIVKSGIIKNKQRYLCKNCNYFLR